MPAMSNKTKDEAPLDGTVPSPELEELKKAAEGLTYPSETDAPFELFFWNEDSTESPSVDVVAKHLRRSPAEIRSASLDDLFEPLVEEEDWHNDEEQEAVRRYKALLETLKSSLKQVKVFCSGEVKIDIYIIGCVANGYAGLLTQAIET